MTETTPCSPGPFAPPQEGLRLVRPEPSPTREDGPGRAVPASVASSIGRRLRKTCRFLAAPATDRSSDGRAKAPSRRSPVRPAKAARRPTESLEAIRKRHETLVQELRLAEEVQRGMLPRVLPTLPWVAFGAALRPSLHLAGDFYNVLRLDRDRVGLYLGDVMGHGPAAALLGVFAMQGIRTKKIEGSHYELLGPAKVLEELNDDLIRADFPGRPFVTMVYGILDASTLTLSFGVGGHPPALLLRPGEPAARIEGGGILLGVFEATFEEQTLQLRPGDRVAFYSDGAESVQWAHHGHGVDGLASALSPRDGRSPQSLVDEAMALGSPGMGPADDVTVVLLEIFGDAGLGRP